MTCHVTGHLQAKALEGLSGQCARGSHVFKLCLCLLAVTLIGCIAVGCFVIDIFKMHRLRLNIG